MAIQINGTSGISGVDGSAGTPAIQGTDTNTGLTFGTDTVGIVTGGTTRATVDSSGRLGIGTTSPSDLLHIAGAYGAGAARFEDTANTNSIGKVFGYAGGLYLQSRNNTNYGEIVFRGENSGGTAERARIDSSGRLLVGKTTAGLANSGFEVTSSAETILTRNADTPLQINRLTDDGALVGFYQASALEGTISVSGTTVSYNGAHLSRWSQLPSGAERTEILRGSVLSNIDEMCEWGDEENEQLNRMKVSDVEGDKNVSGVFQAWDDDDDTYINDFYCAMTGDFVIRIAEGVTVERGDLLMSAGDGTAKPQDDDIIRSKTIAKVTSTNVSCTYDDGSYCVPCVLMAC